MKNNITPIIKKITSDFEEINFKEFFHDLGIDSIELIAIRVEIEKLFGLLFLEEEWFSFRTPADIVHFLEKKKAVPILTNNTLKPIFKINRNTKINMPQMANSGLSENWLFKELGDIHWTGISDGLQTDSSNLVDEFGDRLYATFIFISLSCKPLTEFKENELLKFDAKLDRYGDNIYRTRITVNNNLNAELLTSFTKRNGKGNSILQKSVPSVKKNEIREISLPSSLQEYKLVRKNLVKTIFLSEKSFEFSEEVLFEMTHPIIPYYEINGVGLLYFAAYPIISDIGELAYRKAFKLTTTYTTIARKIFYLANCDSSDNIIYRLNSFEEEGNTIKTQCTLYRRSDGKKMAIIFTVKEKSVFQRDS